MSKEESVWMQSQLNDLNDRLAESEKRALESPGEL